MALSNVDSGMNHRRVNDWPDHPMQPSPRAIPSGGRACRAAAGQGAGGGAVTATKPAPRQQASLVHDAYLAIETGIVTLEFRPGSLVTERAIIESTGFGRTPVREALQRLNLLGLIEIHPRRGIKIVEVRPEDYPRAIEPRLTLEPLLARSAARYAGPKDHETIAEVMRDMIDCAERGDVIGFLHQDKALDETVSAAAANPFLPRILEPLQIHSRRFWFQYHGAEGLKESAAAHAKVCKAIIAGDGEAAFHEARKLTEFLFAQSKAV